MALGHMDSPPAAAAVHCADHSLEQAYLAPVEAVVSTAADWHRQHCWNWSSLEYERAVWLHKWDPLHSVDALAASVAVAVSGIDVD